MEHVRVETDGGVAVVTLVDVERRNAMTALMVDEIVATFDTLEADGTTAAVVVTGEPPAFCSGADVSSLGALAKAETDTERRSVTSIYQGFLRVLRSPLPTIAAVNGPAVGAGMNLALACDVRVAGASARFDTRFVKIGLHPGGGHVWMLERAVGPQAAAAMVLFGVAVDGLGHQLVAPLAPFLDRHRVADVVFVLALDLQETHGRALVAQPELVGYPAARTVAGNDRRFQPVQLQRVERVLHDQHDTLG